MPQLGTVETKRLSNSDTHPMLRFNTPVEDYNRKYGLFVKREDLACKEPGPQFSKTRGVYAHVKSRPEKLIGVLDTVHSQAGHAVAFACKILGKKCINFYPVPIRDPDPKPPQIAAQELGAELVGLPAGRSAILYHAARKQTEERGGYIMPNALKLPESVAETAKEVESNPSHGGYPYVLIPISSGTIAAGVILGLSRLKSRPLPTFLIHLGYSRSHSEVLHYLHEQSGIVGAKIILVDEKYAYRDVAREGETPPWPCNEWYDLKAFRWWRSQHKFSGPCLFWNIG